MRFAIAIVLLALGAAPATQPLKRTGPSAASLATAYSGPLKFDPRVLAAERKAAFNADPVSRAATWRYYYSWPGYWGGYGYGWSCYGGYYGGYYGGGFRAVSGSRALTGYGVYNYRGGW